jgi:hypothetical protein
MTALYLKKLEVDAAAELEAAHGVLRGELSDTAGSGIGDVGVGQAEIGVVEGVGGVTTESEAEALGQAEALGKRNVLVDEARTIRELGTKLPNVLAAGERKAPPRPRGRDGSRGKAGEAAGAGWR